jgi:glc operon protein GlcG
MKAFLLAALFVPALASPPASAKQDLVVKHTLSLEGARGVLAAAEAEAKRVHAGGAIAIVDDGGNLILVERLDGTFSAGANISIGKARTAALFKKPTSRFETIINEGRTAMAALGDFTPLQVGVPIEVDGQIVGAIGVSGAASAQQDEEIAIAGANAAKSFGSVASKPAVLRVSYFEKSAVNAAVARGEPLFESDGAHLGTFHMGHMGARTSNCAFDADGSTLFITAGEALWRIPVIPQRAGTR